MSGSPFGSQREMQLGLAAIRKRFAFRESAGLREIHLDREAPLFSDSRFVSQHAREWRYARNGAFRMLDLEGLPDGDRMNRSGAVDV